VRLPRPLRAVVLAWHIAGSVSWFAFLAGQVWLPWFPFQGLLIVAASVAVSTGVILLLTSPPSLLDQRWLRFKILGTLAVMVSAALAMHGHYIPYSRVAAVGVLWGCIWLSTARPWSRARKSQLLGRHAR
jgi:hypothetical protein